MATLTRRYRTMRNSPMESIEAFSEPPKHLGNRPETGGGRCKRLAIPLLAVLALAGCDAPPPAAHTKRLSLIEPIDGGYDGIYVYRDRDTGCDYIVTVWNTPILTPRLDRDGKPKCGGGR